MAKEVSVAAIVPVKVAWAVAKATAVAVVISVATVEELTTTTRVEAWLAARTSSITTAMAGARDRRRSKIFD